METKILYLLHLVIALCISTPVLAQITVSRSAKQRLNGQEKDSNQQSGLYFEHTDVQFPLLEENSEPYVAYYSYINRATTSIRITRVEASCGCMDVSYDSKPVLPGGKGTIQVTFKPKGYSGTIYREIFVYTTQSDEVPSACLGLMVLSNLQTILGILIIITSEQYVHVNLQLLSASPKGIKINWPKP